jgi:hypothetical protein
LIFSKLKAKGGTQMEGGLTQMNFWFPSIKRRKSLSGEAFQAKMPQTPLQYLSFTCTLAAFHAFELSAFIRLPSAFICVPPLTFPTPSQNQNP